MTIQPPLGARERRPCVNKLTQRERYRRSPRPDEIGENGVREPERYEPTVWRHSSPTFCKAPNRQEQAVGKTRDLHQRALRGECLRLAALAANEFAHDSGKPGNDGLEAAVEQRVPAAPARASFPFAGGIRRRRLPMGRVRRPDRLAFAAPVKGEGGRGWSSRSVIAEFARNGVVSARRPLVGPAG